MTDYFINFAPADAVQYDGSEEATALALTWVPSGWELYREVEWCDHDNCTVRLSPGQWLVRQDTRVWVQDEEPARVERWETGRMSPGGDVWDHDWLSWWPEYRRPVLSNGWTGPWAPVEGGAE